MSDIDLLIGVGILVILLFVVAKITSIILKPKNDKIGN